MRSDAERLRDILDAIAAIELHTSSGRERFDSDPLIRVWVVHHLILIGEACARMSAAATGPSPNVPWRQISALRNILVHQYFGIDPDLVWAIVERDLGVLRDAVRRMLDQFEG